MQVKRNLYIVADGIGGTGKDTVLEHLKSKFVELGYRVVMTYEPGGTPEADALRAELFTRKEKGTITPSEELRYVFEARQLNMEQIVLPALRSEEPTVVLKARDYMSSFIYQVASGASRDLLMEFYRKYYEGMGFPKPDLRLLMVLDPETAMRRRLGAGAGGDGFDLQPDAYWQRVALGYYNEAMDISQRRGLFRGETKVIDASKSITLVCRESWRVVSSQLRLEDEETVEGGMVHRLRREGNRGRVRGWYK